MYKAAEARPIIQRIFIDKKNWGVVVFVCKFMATTAEQKKMIIRSEFRNILPLLSLAGMDIGQFL